jgi:hypothetical protein
MTGFGRHADGSEDRGESVRSAEFTWAHPSIKDPIYEFEHPTASVWQLDRENKVWRRVAGPGAESFEYKNGKIAVWIDGEWHR